MKAILEYNFDDSDDIRDHQLAVKANSLSIILWDIDQWLRNEVKYQTLPEGFADAYDKVRDKLRELAGEYDVLNLVFE